MSGAKAVPAKLTRTIAGKKRHKAKARSSKYGPGRTHFMVQASDNLWWPLCDKVRVNNFAKFDPVPWESDVDCAKCLGAPS